MKINIDPSSIIVTIGAIGCVDKDTEYLTPTGWKKISEYNGEKILQYNPNGTASFVYPQDYVVYPATTFYNFKTTKGIDQMVSPEHRVVYLNKGGNIRVKSAEEIYQNHNITKTGFRGKFITSFNPIINTYLDISNENLRVQVMVCADGYLPSLAATKERGKSKRCHLRLKKDRKIERAKFLLKKANIDYDIRFEEATGFTIFKFSAPIRTKSMSNFWNASLDQLKLISEECLYWDGCVIDKRKTFHTRDKETADFIQYAFVSSGYRAALANYQRDDGIDYVVSVCNRITTTISGSPKSPINKIDGTGEKKYCFKTDTSYWVMRRNGKICVTGNTGKTTFLEAKFAPHHIVSSDFIREQLTGDFQDQSHNSATFEILFATLEARAKAGLLTVVDSTGSQSVLNKAKELAKRYDRSLYAFVFPHLDESEMTEERLQHRMRLMHVYYRQVERINKTDLPSDFITHVIPKEGRFSDVEIDIKQKTNTWLPSEYQYVVVPDLHGEYDIIKSILRRYAGDDGVKIIQLGDICDRGPSSHYTFYACKQAVDEGKMFAITGNHDNKFYRYLKKWLDDDSIGKYSLEDEEYELVPDYGMKINCGLQVTLQEFYSLPKVDMIRYAHDFVAYYKSLPSYLRLQKDNTYHVFAHAGFNSGMLVGEQESKSLNHKAMYGTVYGIEDGYPIVEDIISKSDKNFVFHLGHNYVADKPIHHNYRNMTIIQHDIGMGKRKLDYTPEFYKI